MIILGIDPGSYNVGYGILQIEKRKIVAAGCNSIMVGKSISLDERLVKIHAEMQKIIYEYKPNVSAVETIFYGKNIRSAFTLGHARGVILLSLAQANIKANEYSPREVKKAVVGNGNATKEQVKYMVQQILNIDLSKKSEDATDALAIALCEYNKNKFFIK